MAAQGSGRPEALRYNRRPLLVLVNGLAEQAETWYRNDHYWRRYFDVHAPNLLDYRSPTLHRRIAAGLPIDVEYLVGRLMHFLEEFAPGEPCFLVASSLGGKVAVELAARFPERVRRMVLLCPSGLGDMERLPLVDGLRFSDARGLVESVFHDPDWVEPGLVRYYQEGFADRRWRLGLVKTVRGTTRHCVRHLLPRIMQPTLIISGREDRIVDPERALQAVRLLPRGRHLMIPNCGHAPQLERPRLINRLVVRFLKRGLSGVPNGPGDVCNVTPSPAIQVQ